MNTDNSEKQRENLKAAIEAQLLHTKKLTEKKLEGIYFVSKI